MSAIYLQGKSKNPRMSALQAIAQVLQVDLRYLLGQSDTITAEDRRRGIAPIPVKGIVEVGAYRPMLQKIKNSQGRDVLCRSEFKLSTCRPFCPAGPRRRHERCRYPGRNDGALCRFATAGLGSRMVKSTPSDGRYDGGKTFETSLKRAHVYRDRIEYRPESR
jgi:hypothetical protein